MNVFAPLHNPVMQRELAHQQHTAGIFGSQRLQWAYRILYYPALALALLVFFSELGAALQPGEDRSAALTLHVVVIFALVVAVLMHLYLLLQTLVRAAASVARERQAGTWDDLIMTGTDARQLIIGKWWATLRGLLGGYLLLIPLRAGIVVWLGAVFDRTQVLNIDAVRDFVAPGILSFFATFPIIGLFTLGGAMLVASISVLASTLSRTLVQALALAIALTALIFGGVLVTLAITHQVVQQETARSPEWQSLSSPLLETVLISWLDNGITLTSELVNYETEYENVSRQYVADAYASRKATAWVLTFVVCIGLYGLLTWGTLRLAQVWAVRQGALPPARIR